jgi:hypothetical protein
VELADGCAGGVFHSSSTALVKDSDDPIRTMCESSASNVWLPQMARFAHICFAALFDQSLYCSTPESYNCSSSACVYGQSRCKAAALRDIVDAVAHNHSVVPRSSFIPALQTCSLYETNISFLRACIFAVVDAVKAASWDSGCESLLGSASGGEWRPEALRAAIAACDRRLAEPACSIGIGHRPALCPLPA